MELSARHGLEIDEGTVELCESLDYIGLKEQPDKIRAA